MEINLVPDSSVSSAPTGFTVVVQAAAAASIPAGSMSACPRRPVASRPELAILSQQFLPTYLDRGARRWG
jgi:hypothetical protein